MISRQKYRSLCEIIESLKISLDKSLDFVPVLRSGNVSLATDMGVVRADVCPQASPCTVSAPLRNMERQWEAGTRPEPLISSVMSGRDGVTGNARTVLDE